MRASTSCGLGISPHHRPVGHCSGMSHCDDDEAHGVQLGLKCSGMSLRPLLCQCPGATMANATEQAAEGTQVASRVGIRKPEVRACRLLPPAASPWREHAVFSPCPHKNTRLCVWVLISSFEDTGHVASGSTVVASFKVPNSKHSHVLRGWGQDLTT